VIIVAVGEKNSFYALGRDAQELHIVQDGFGGLGDIEENVSLTIRSMNLQEQGDPVASPKRRVIPRIVFGENGNTDALNGCFLFRHDPLPFHFCYSHGVLETR
jgi:hypothetical protein